MAKITIETESAAELRKVFTDLFGTPTAKAESAEKPVAPKAAAKPAEAKPAEAKPAEAKPAEAKPAEAKPAEAKPAEAKPAEVKPAEVKEPTYAEVMDRIKKMKATTNPNIVSAVKVWKEEGNHPDLKSMTGAELLTVVAFLDTLTPEA